MKPRSRAILAGLIWGAIQAAILTVAVGTGLIFVQSRDTNQTLLKNLVQGLVSVAGLLTGYVLGEAESTAEALLVSQFLATAAFEGALLIFPPPVIIAYGVFQAPFAALPAFYFVLAIVGAFPGGFLGEWIKSMSNLSIDWRPLSLALCLTGPVYALSLVTIVYPPPSYRSAFSPLLLGDWNLSLLLMILSVLAGVGLSVLGLYRNRFLKPTNGGLLVMGSMIVAVLLLAQLYYADSFYSSCLGYPQSLPCDQAQYLVNELWLLGSTLLIPAIILLGFAVPKHWSSTMDKTRPLPK